MPNTAAQAGSASPTTEGGNPRQAVLVNLAVNLAAPVALFYGLRAAGVDQWWALLIGMVPPAIRAVQTVITNRRIDGLALLALVTLLLSVAASFVTGSPRLLLAKDGWLTAVGGFWILATLARTPFYLQAIRSLITGPIREQAETAWRESARFRHVMRVSTIIWGAGLVADAGVRVVLAYALPIDEVPLISGLQYVLVFAALEISTQVYVRRSGVLADPNDKPEPEQST